MQQRVKGCRRVERQRQMDREDQSLFENRWALERAMQQRVKGWRRDERQRQTDRDDHAAAGEEVEEG